jgi:TolA-binding protein
LAKKEKTLGLEALDTLETVDNLGFVLGRMGQEAAAEEFLRRALIGRQNVLGDEHPDTQNSRFMLGELLSSREDFVGAEPLVAMWITVHRKNVTSPIELADAMAWLGWMRTKLKRYAEAEAVLRDCLATREKHMPNDWRIFNTKSLLGEALLGQKQPEDAKPFLLSGYEGLKEREGEIPAESKSNLTEAVLRIVNLYKSKSEHAEATKWKRELKRWTNQENQASGQSL